MKAQINFNEAGSGDDGSEWAQGYGYQMWCCTHGAYRLDGAWGQFCIIMPDKNAVVAMHSQTRDTEAAIKAVWKEIYPYL